MDNPFIIHNYKKYSTHWQTKILQKLASIKLIKKYYFNLSYLGNFTAQSCIR